jgi:tetratricopeptide (TPR) repeat protein
LLDDVPPADLSDSRAAAAAAAALAAFGGAGPPREGTSLFPELLDDNLPPADSTRGATAARVDNRNASQQFQARRDEKNLFPDGLLTEIPIESNSRTHAVGENDGFPSDYRATEKKEQGPSRLEQRLRYPVEELYPNDNNDVIMGYCDDDRTNHDHGDVEYEIGHDDDYYSHMQYSEPIVSDDYKKTQAPSRYPIDDDGYCTDEEGKTTARRRKKVVWYDEQPRMNHKFDVDDAMVISPSGSDGELSAYQPMHLHSTSPNDRSRFFDGNDEHSSSHYSDDNKSTGTFDRLYDDEYSSIYSTPMETSDNDGNAKTFTPSSYKSPIKDEKNSSFLPRLSPENSPDSVLDTPGSTPGSFLGDVFGPTQEDLHASTETIDRMMNRENIERTDPKPVNQSPNGGGSDGAPTPLRSNRNNERPSGRSHQVNESPRAIGGDAITESVENSPADTDISDDLEVDGSPKSCKTESPQSSPGVDSDEDSAIQDLARLMHQQQRQHRQQERFAHQENQYYQVPQGDGNMSRLEQWQQKQQQLQLQHAATNYLPSKYLQQSHQAVPTRNRQKYPPKLEPEDANPRDPDGVRYYGGDGEKNLFPDVEWDEHGNLIKGTVPKQRTQVVTAPFMSPSSKDDQYHPDFANVSMVSSATERVTHPASPSMASNTIVSGHDTLDRNRIYRAVPHRQVPDELSLLESYDDYSNDEALANSSNSMQDDVSVISEDTELRRLAQQVPMKQKLQRQQRFHPYTVKPKDSMESDMKLELDEEETRPHSYNVIKRNDSMEQDMMVLDFVEEVLPTKHTMKDFPIDDLGVNIIEYDDKSLPGTSVMSPPPLKRQQFSFTENIEEEEDEDPIIPLKSYSDESEATNDPAIFPTRAVFQMNLGQDSSNKESCESSDLVERACEFLARGRNEDALRVLNEALDYAQASMDSVKELMDVHYYHKERGLRPPTSEQLLSQEEYEGKLNADFRKVASEMADIINNIGVVHELNGDYHLAMNSFRDALDVYRRMCHRYENSGDADVDRTVTNIMYMGIAMRSRDKREELHLEAEDLAAMIDASDDPDERMELRRERLNILMSVVDVENESLGRSE